MDSKKSIKLLTNSTISNIIEYLEQIELHGIKNIFKKKFNIAVVCLLQLHDIDKSLVISGSCDSSMKIWNIEKDHCI